MVALTAYMASRATPAVAVNIADGNDSAQQHLLSPTRQRLRASGRAPRASVPAPAETAPQPVLGFQEQQTVALLREKLGAGSAFAVRNVRLTLHPDTILVCGEYRLAADSSFALFARVNSALYAAPHSPADSELAQRAFARCSADARTTDAAHGTH